jgi:uncharacterized protein DUF1707
VLKAAFAEGRLDSGEYADRVGLARASRTYGDLGALVADLPAGPLGTLAPAPVQALAPVQAPARKPRNTLETAALAMVVLIIPAVAILFAVVGGLALLLHV